MGVITEIELGSDDTTMVIFGDGDVKPPYGLFGGKESVLNRIAITYPDGKQVVPMSKDMIEGIPAGTVYHQIASGGGGYGNPEEREREKVLRDVRNGVVSRKQAEEIYNIKLDED